MKFLRQKQFVFPLVDTCNAALRLMEYFPICDITLMSVEYSYSLLSCFQKSGKLLFTDYTTLPTSAF